MNSKIRIGYWDRTCTETLWYPREAHGFLCAAARSGKFRDVLAPMLFTWRGSCLVIDPKGQAAAVTARYRQKTLGQRVYMLNPFGVLPEYLGRFRAAQFDPMQTLCENSHLPTFGADADNLAEALVTHEGQGPDSHWVESARLLVSGVIMRLASAFSGVNLTSVYSMISGPELFPFAQEAMRSRDDFVAERLARFADPDASENKEVRGIISTAITQLGFIGNRCIAESLSASSFDFRDMKRQPPMTVYLILPGRYLASCSKWFRLIVGAAVDAFLHEGERDVPVLGILDEFSSAVGRLKVIETAMGLAAGYGLQLIPVLQDLSQLQGLYPQTWETFLSNSGFRIFFSPRDKTTSDYVSAMCGDTEIRGISKSLSLQRDNALSVGLGYAQQARRYLRPEEVRELPGDEMLVFGELPGVIRAGRRPYYLSPEFKGCYDADPYHNSEKEKRGAGLLGALSGR